MNFKGVSETVGYIFIFGIVMTTVAYAFIHVSAIVKDTSDKYKIEGLRESFKRIQNVFFLSAYGGAPMQSIQSEIQGGRFYLSPEPEIKIEVIDSSGSHSILNTNIGALNFEYGNYRISIENGAVYENYYGFERTVVDPRIFIYQIETQSTPGNYHKVLTIILYKVKGNLSVSGMGALDLIFISNLNSSMLKEEGGYVNLTIEKSSFTKKWCEYLGLLTTEIRCADDIVTTSFQFDKLVIAIFDVEVRYRILS